MFMGEYHQKIDEKGRLIIPAKLRYDLGENFIITRGLDGCLFVYPKNVWDNIIREYKNLPNIKDTRNFMRIFLSGANCENLDRQGRVNISSLLIEHADLNKECIVIGVGDRIEIWSSDRWDKLNEENENNFSLIADKLFNDNLN